MRPSLEQELPRLVQEQRDLGEQVISAELELETVKVETAQFQRRYYETVGRLYAQLDDLEARIASFQADLTPDDVFARIHAENTWQQARKSAEEAGLIEAQIPPPLVITPELKQAFRRAAMMMHPDRASSEPDRQRRHGFMIKLNLAYERGDQHAIEKLVLNFIQGSGMQEVESPGEIPDLGVELQALQVVRRTGELRRRLKEIQDELRSRRQSDLYKMKITIERAETRGGNPLGDLAEKILQELSEKKVRLEQMILAS